MAGAIAQVQDWQQELAALALSQSMQNLQPGEFLVLRSPDVASALRTWAETRNLLDVAHLILKSAHFRTESRGGHYRSDYPQTDPAWQVHTLVQAERWWTAELEIENGE